MLLLRTLPLPQVDLDMGVCYLTSGTGMLQLLRRARLGGDLYRMPDSTI